ncbi:hypothetical protein ACYCFL_05635 [Stutzerimonas nitrititolerans]|uniref:hypothetical protein n=1 Tax=Stutzerimonas nitrititolerans TaxID=2482751 RepID=UPI00289EF640|nr:hypothetical protein [Stutzerimonas nitrititolerans]
MKTDEFIQQHVVDGNLTAEQAAELIQLAEAGDTGGESPEDGGVPSATTDDAQEPEGSDNKETVAEQEKEQQAPEADPAGAVVLAKDGKHTIPYEKLTQAREGEKTAKAALEAANAEIERLRAEAQQRADDGKAPTEADANLAIAEKAMEQGIDPGLFGDFSEEALAKGVQALVDSRVEAAVAKALEPIKAKQQADAEQTAEQAHWAAIYAKHADADSVIESKELADWIASQPGFVRRGFEQVMQSGTAAEAVEMLDAFKAATGPTQQPTPAADVKAAAKAAVANARPAVPASLSDIPGGAAPQTRDEAMRQMDAVQLSDAMANMTPAQIEEYLSRSL